MPKIAKRPKSILERIEAEIAEIQALIANKQAELRQLRDTAAVIRRLEGSTDKMTFAGKKIRECVIDLLRETPNQHYKAMAREAVARGYTSQKGGDLEIISRSFLSCLNLYSMQFEKTGKGTFSLKERKENTTT